MNFETLPLKLIGEDSIVHAYRPSTGVDGKITYTYRMHHPEDTLEIPRPIAGTSDWNITEKLGRWQLQVLPEHGFSDPIEFKINKRGQMATHARDFVDFWTDRPASSKVAGQGIARTYFSTVKGRQLFAYCHQFSRYIYNRHGLFSQSGGQSDPSGPDAWTATDDGIGSVRQFIGHSSIIVERGLLLGGRIVDVNNPGATQDEQGPERGVFERDWYFRSWPGNIPASIPDAEKTLIDPDGTTEEDGQTPKSWLKVLDGE